MGPYHSRAAEEEDSEVGEERDTCSDQEWRENSSAVLHTSGGYLLVHVGWMRMVAVTRGDHELACIEEDVLNVVISPSGQEQRTLRNWKHSATNRPSWSQSKTHLQ